MSIVANISSSIAAAIIEKRLRDGKTVEIPSLGITLKGQCAMTPADEWARRLTEVGLPFALEHAAALLFQAAQEDAMDDQRERDARVAEESSDRQPAAVSAARKIAAAIRALE